MLVSKRISRADFVKQLRKSKWCNLSANCVLQISPFSKVEDSHINPKQGFEECEKKERNNKLKDGTKFKAQARARFSRNLSAFSMNYTGKFAFVTFTIPPTRFDYAYDAELLDNVLVLAIQRLFKRLRREKLISEFAWVAERHTENAEKHKVIYEAHKDFLHFHCFFFYPKYIDIQYLNKMWLSILQRIEILQTQIKNSAGDYYQPVDAEFADVSQNVTVLLSYVKKYCSKDSEVGKVFARRWGWSRGLSSIIGVKKVDVTDIEQVIEDCNILDEREFSQFFEVTCMGTIKGVIYDEQGKSEIAIMVDSDNNPILTPKFKFFTCQLPFFISQLDSFKNHFTSLKQISKYLN